ncbi:MAG: hypothetical protein DCE86_04675 [Flavobacteriaceae bacterium]|uniref:acyltransferase family protein n=1 Tax=Flavobacterium sp. Leaf359 TaxID=1736351 RepID=UPI0006F9B71B|nr:acyltransferase [Flavobacterium sp. Leaf359]KQS52733.1 hypothetical protein ASG38_16520 [Flavobacterium sp. Leaf359]PZO33450.1 MAG: hypothetical protein DCE86_04675 [Flavobacteriaceae bacterium]
MNKYLSLKIKIISFLSIVMVVLLHCYNLDIKHSDISLVLEKDYNWFIQNFISYGITRVAVPIFFIISGYLFFYTFKGNNDFLSKIKKRFFTLVIPFLFWSGFGILFYFILQSIPQGRVFFSKKLIVDFNFLDWWRALITQPISYQLWFLRDLIVLTILSPIIFIIIRRFGIFFLFAIFPFWFLTIDNIMFTSEALLFFSLGLFLCLKHRDILNKQVSRKTALTFLCIWLTLLIIKTTLQMYYENHFIIFALQKLSICIGIVAIWLIYDAVFPLFKNKLQKTDVYGLSFFIYVFHEPFLTLVKKGLFFILGKSVVDHFLIFLISGPIVITICLILGYFFKTKLPDLYNFTTGNRG